MRSSDVPRASWRKSSRSNHGSESDCLEVAELPNRVVMRNSKDPAGPVLAFTRAEWQAVLGDIRTGEFG
ncbi:MAG: DUF397 domain-containing protein [Pseudonocardiaceae bacterium]